MRFFKKHFIPPPLCSNSIVLFYVCWPGSLLCWRAVHTLNCACIWQKGRPPPSHFASPGSFSLRACPTAFLCKICDIYLRWNNFPEPVYFLLSQTLITYCIYHVIAQSQSLLLSCNSHSLNRGSSEGVGLFNPYRFYKHFGSAIFERRAGQKPRVKYSQPLHCSPHMTERGKLQPSCDTRHR